MEYHLTILGRLEGLNNYTAANRTHPIQGSKMKREAEDIVIWHIRQQLRNLHIDNMVILKYDFFEPNKKRDLDNISSFAHKVIQDSLVKTGVLKNDGWKGVCGFVDQFYCDPLNPRIEVTIKEVGD